MWVRMAAVAALVFGLLATLGFMTPQPALAAEVTECTYDALVEAVNTTPDGGTVTFDCVNPTISFAGETSIMIIKTLTIDGSNGGNPITLDGANQTNFFYIPTGISAGLTIENLTLQNGQAVYGGAINVGHDGMLTVIACTFTNNHATSAGAIYNGGTLKISRSSFTNNEAGGGGGAIWNDGAAEVSQSSFANNAAAQFGGAIYNNGTLTLSTSTLSGNTSGGAGSAIHIATVTQTTIEWSTIVQAEGASPALYAGSPVALVGVIIDSPNVSCQFGGPFGGTPNDSYTIASDDSCQLDPNAGSQVVDDVGLPDDPSTQTMPYGVEQVYYTPLPISPAVGSGGSDCLSPDQIDILRPDPVTGLCDVGAIETAFLPIEPVELCANRWNGSLRMPSGDSCSGSETLIALPDDGPVTICANAWNGDARYSPSGVCNGNETLYEARGDDSIPVCVNRWNGSLRVSEVCSGSEWGDAI